MIDRVNYILKLKGQAEDGYNVNPAIYRALIGCLDNKETSELLIYSIEHNILTIRNLVNRKIHFDLCDEKKYCYEDLAIKALDIAKKIPISTCFKLHNDFKCYSTLYKVGNPKRYFSFFISI